MTGGTGLAGRFVVEDLVSGGPGRTAHEVVVLDRRDAPVPDGASFVAADVESPGDLDAALAGVDAVAHLAAVPRPGLVADGVLFRTNVDGCFNVHEAARRHGIERVVTCSSTAVLGWDWGRRDVVPAYLPFDEDHPLRPEDAYALSKLCCEEIARSFHLRCGMQTPVLRPPWIVSPQRLAELKAEGGRRPDGFHHYAYVDARDLAAAFRLALERPDVGHTVLFTAAADTSTAASLAAVLPRLLPAARRVAAGLTGFRSAISSERAKAMLGWRPRHSWRDGAAEAR